MTALVKEINDTVRAFPQDKRSELAHEMIESLDTQAATDVDSAWEAEIARRVAEIKGGAAIGFPAESDLAEIRARR